tara:strand:- start:1335 stop:1460 length:126 start_codon:yes stop_codon:yes gene_type:complete
MSAMVNALEKTGMMAIVTMKMEQDIKLVYARGSINSENYQS